MRSRLTTTLLLAAVAAPAAVSIVYAADSSRGRALYEVRCIECHDQSVHGRQKRVAKNYDDIRTWVARWNNELGGSWGKEEVEDVTAFLNERFYSYSCTNVEC